MLLAQGDSLKIGVKITGMAILPIALTTVVALGVALYQKEVLKEFFGREIEEQAKSEAQKIARDVYLMCRSAQEAVQKTVNHNLLVAEDALKRSGPVSFGRDKVTWTAVNQLNHAEATISLPKMMVGGKWLGQNRDRQMVSPVVDEVKRLVGGSVTIFQRMNDKGDMLRVCTNVENADGSRAIGTYIPAAAPDGTPSPVITTLLEGKRFQGRAYVVNAWYVTAYEPIWDSDRKKIVGALYVGVKEENLESLRKGIMDIVVGKTGYVFVLGGSGAQQGQYLISKDGKRDGENLWNSLDADGHPFVQTIIGKALALRREQSDPIPVDFMSYSWKNPDEPAPRYKSVAITYFEPWDWVIGAGYYESDLADPLKRMATALDRMGSWVMVTALVMVLLSVPAGYLVARGIRTRVDSILKSVTDILIVTDSHQRIILLSQSAEKIFGSTLKKVAHCPIEALIGDNKLPEEITSVLAQQKSGMRFEFEIAPVGSDQRHIMQGRTSVIQAKSGRTLGMITIIHDITNEREIDRMKSEFISTAAHELSTPLASIIGYSELLLSETSSPDVQNDALSYINRKAWALSRIVDDLLDLSRIEAGRSIPVDKKPCDINEIIRQAVLYGQKISVRHTFELHLSDQPGTLLADSGKLEQVMENLLSNAVKYYPDGGPVRISSTRLEDAWQVCVDDRGIGMAPEQVERIFDRFYRADASNTAIEGTGLGMCIVKNILEAHGGEIWVESTPGVGTKVFFTVPLGA
ncbi:hypothetical protein AOG1_29410 [Geobacter sp. AOG1]|nr:hypothetical protein AOG1_29410 [Geobacter sp. AOG1]